ncbi:MAG: lipoyl(octanoyl) transferase LipB [Pseudomonadota bacterium]|nr:lipoyl(octanoyl) transferase LipB [Pseudomonadota bacterium]
MFLDWGLIDYQTALAQQLSVLASVVAGTSDDKIIFCSHPPIVTIGRGTMPGDVFAWEGSTAEIQRGGRATYHGPSQLVIYPIINLQRPNALGKKKLIGIRAHIKFMEDAVINVLKDLGIKATGKIGKDETGVWIGDKKICSIGIGVKRWVTYHGLALNVDHDPQAFQGLNPCGFRSNTMISVEELLGYKVSRAGLIEKFQSHFENFRD